MGKLLAEITDQKSGKKLEARVQILDPTGIPIGPKASMWKKGPGEPFFYTNGQFEMDVTSGYYQILVERGTEYTPYKKDIFLTSSKRFVLDIPLERWGSLPEKGWHPGNTHLHYDEKEKDPNRRLKYDSRVEDLRMTAISILKRGNLNYATNDYPHGVLNEFSDTHHHVQNGEETRHNSKPWEIGYGHVMLLDIKNTVEPVSRGVLVDQFEPDYPPLTYACDKAIDQNGLVIWCHNGQGMEAPVAAILKKVHAINLFDPYWIDVEYTLWYHMLNCGIKLPVSTGTDWFVCSSNRVYTLSEPSFDYSKWVKQLRSGRTFITNGPALMISIEENVPGDTITTVPGKTLNVKVAWESYFQIENVEIIFNGIVVSKKHFNNGSKKSSFEVDIEVKSDGWIAARVNSSKRDSFFQPIWAHTSPIYISGTDIPSDELTISSDFFAKKITEGIEWVKIKGRFYSDVQRKEVIDLFKHAKNMYQDLT